MAREKIQSFQLTRLEWRFLNYLAENRRVDNIHQRVRTILAIDREIAQHGFNANRIASKLNITPNQFKKLIQRFDDYGLQDICYPFAVKKKGPRGALKAESDILLAMAAAAPENVKKWTTRSLGKHLGLSHNHISRVWRKYAIIPHAFIPNDSISVKAIPDKKPEVVGFYSYRGLQAMVFAYPWNAKDLPIRDVSVPAIENQPPSLRKDIQRQGIPLLEAAIEGSRLLGKSTKLVPNWFDFREFVDSVARTHGNCKELVFCLHLDPANSPELPKPERASKCKVVFRKWRSERIWLKKITERLWSIRRFRKANTRWPAVIAATSSILRKVNDIGHNHRVFWVFESQDEEMQILSKKIATRQDWQREPEWYKLPRHVERVL